jgi:predicted  nucleic acid-binding Zn-ribbon protein
VSELVDIGKAYVALDGKVKELESELRNLKKQRTDLGLKLHDAMILSDMASMRTTSGELITATSKLRASLKGGVADGAQKLKELEDWAFLVTETVNAARLEARVREVIAEREEAGEDGLPPSVMDVISVYEQPVISVRRS